MLKNDDKIPPLNNGMERVTYHDAELGPGIPKLSVIVTEDMPLAVMSANSGLELVFEAHDGANGYPWSAVIRAKRRDDPPQIIDADSINRERG